MVEDKKLGYFRSTNYEDNAQPIKLCKHIEIDGKLISHDQGCEYIESIKIMCNLCKIRFVLEECIN